MFPQIDGGSGRTSSTRSAMDYDRLSKFQTKDLGLRCKTIEWADSTVQKLCVEAVEGDKLLKNTV